MTLVSALCYKNKTNIEGFMLADSKYILYEDEDIIHSLVSDKIAYAVLKKKKYLLGSAGSVDFIENVEPGIVQILNSGLPLEESIKLVPPYLKSMSKKRNEKDQNEFLICIHTKKENPLFYKISNKKQKSVNSFACIGSGEYIAKQELEDLLVHDDGKHISLSPEEALYRIISSANITSDTVTSVGGPYQIIHVANSVKEFSKEDAITASIVSRLMSNFVMSHKDGFVILEQLIYGTAGPDILFNLSMRDRSYFDFIMYNHTLHGKPKEY